VCSFGNGRAVVIGWLVALLVWEDEKGVLCK
jgi:hypothetical protein